MNIRKLSCIFTIIGYSGYIMGTSPPNPLLHTYNTHIKTAENEKMVIDIYLRIRKESLSKTLQMVLSMVEITENTSEILKKSTMINKQRKHIQRLLKYQKYKEELIQRMNSIYNEMSKINETSILYKMKVAELFYHIYAITTKVPYPFKTMHYLVKYAGNIEKYKVALNKAIKRNMNSILHINFPDINRNDEEFEEKIQDMQNSVDMFLSKIDSEFYDIGSSKMIFDIANLYIFLAQIRDVDLPLECLEEDIIAL
ncbi:hypothetical protein NEAUS03_2051 [Nematocida ausubeli]|nr:hypothetical protein NEAUS03_2051 [Nematocida ausubeli]